MDPYISHNYNTRSKGIIRECIDINTPPLKSVDLKTKKDKKDKKDKNFSIKKIFTTVLVKNLVENLYDSYDSEFNSSDDDDEDDADSMTELYDDVPDNLKYKEDEIKYIQTLTDIERKILFDNETKIQNYNGNNIPQRFKILNSELPINIKSTIIDKLNYFNTLESSDSEYHKMYSWVSSLNKIPFDIYQKDQLQISSSKYDIMDYLSNIKKNLDDSVFGHNDAKEQILQFMAQQISNPKSAGTCIAIQGPPGNGKTTLVKHGICKSLNRPFSFIPLGGLQSSEFLMGYDYTYEGSKCGRIIEILQESKCMNPVIYFDELDKLSENNKGSDIENLLCHLTDFTQNNTFIDKYFSGIDFDLSKILFIFSYNDENLINPVLLDRMYKINTDGFDTKSKITICKDFLVPEVCKNIGFNIKDVIFEDDAFKTIITNYTNNEKGVRNLKRSIENIISILNIRKLINTDVNDYENNDNQNNDNENEIIKNTVDNMINDIIIKNNKINDKKNEKLVFPFTVKIEHLSKFLKYDNLSKNPPSMYI